MRGSLRRAALAAVLGMCLISASQASASTEFGDTCAGAGGAPGDYTITTLTGSSPTLPLTAPSAGIITKVKVNSAIEIPVPYPVTVKLLRPAGGNKYTVVGGQSLNAGPGVTVADARIPVQPGDKLGVHGDAFSYGGEVIHVSPFCVGAEGELGALVGDAANGSTVEFFEAAPARTPLAAVIEPDADGDGYGDETQDKCPQSAAVHEACAPVTLSASSTVKKGLASILVTASPQATVTVTGTVKPGKGKSIALSGGTQTVAPGTLAKFTLPFPQKLRTALKALPHKRSLALSVTATAPNLVGTPTTKVLKLHLQGQAKPKPKKHRAKKS
jgi:hypothetical protein